MSVNPTTAPMSYTSWQTQFKDKALMQKALTHKSFAYENKTPNDHNEKLEFLGDAVLDLIIGEYLFEAYPEDDEGHLSKKRASLVNEENLSLIALKMGLDQIIRLGKGEINSNGLTKPRILASCFEALIGGLYQDTDWVWLKDFVKNLFKEEVEALKHKISFEKDYKTRLQEKVQVQKNRNPQYEVLREEGPPHDRQFFVQLKCGEEILSEGSGKSKKIAEQEAARKALEVLDSREEIV